MAAAAMADDCSTRAPSYLQSRKKAKATTPLYQFRPAKQSKLLVIQLMFTFRP